MKSEDREAAVEWGLRLIADVRTLRLLRVEPGNLLRLPTVTDPGGDGPPGCLLSALDGLVNDERLAQSAEAERVVRARKALIGQVGLRYGQPVHEGLAALWRWLREPDTADVAAAMATTWGWPLLWPGSRSRAPIREYCELHAHLTGSVPFDELWMELLADERAGVPLRSQTREVQGWSTNLAELVGAARAAAERLGLATAPLGAAPPPAGVPSPPRGSARGHRRRLTDLIEGLADASLATVPALWVYVCVVSHLRVSLIQNRKKSGLVTFKAANNRARAAQSQVHGGAATLTRLAVLGLHAQGAVAIELRPTIDNEPQRLAKKVRQCVRGYLEALTVLKRRDGATPPPTFGLVLSLCKQQPQSVRHQDKGARWTAQVRALLELIEASPLLQRFVVGVDAAGAERGVPPAWLRGAFDEVQAWHRRQGLTSAHVGRSWSAKKLQDWVETLGSSGGTPAATGPSVNAGPPAPDDPTASPAAAAPDAHETAEAKEQARQRGIDRLLDLLDLADPYEPDVGLKLCERNLLDAAGLGAADLPPAGLHRLGRTVHAGEDFDDPITGLRQLWEAVAALELQAGDRVGHALVLGLDDAGLNDLLLRRPKEPDRGPDAAAAVVPKGPRLAVFRKPRGEHLRDLAWEARVFDQAKHNGVDGAEAHARLAAAASRAFGTRDRADLLVDMAGIGDPKDHPLLPALAFDAPEEVTPWDRELVVADDRWRARFAALRELVVAELVHRRVVVESCPTSNRVVANLERAPIHALLKLGEKRGLKVTLATDDPGIFGRYAADELAELRLNKKQLEGILAANLEACWVRPT
jgi:hypothetical protein